MKWKGHLIVCALLLLVYAKWLSSTLPLLTIRGIAQLFAFVAAALLGTYNGYVRLSPDVDAYPVIRQLIGHRSIMTHSPVVPYLILESYRIGSVRLAFAVGEVTAILAYGFAFGWCAHVFADALEGSGLNSWNIPGSTPKRAKKTVGLICVLATAIFFAARFL